jgi:hypothetical protein
MKCVQHVACLEEVSIGYITIVENPEGSISFGRSWRTWQEAIMLGLFEGEDWIHLAQGRVECQALGTQ